MRLLLFGTIGLTEILLVALVVLLFWGGKKIPEMMKGLGKGVKSFKDGVKGIEDEVTGTDAGRSSPKEPDGDSDRL